MADLQLPAHLLRRQSVGLADTIAGHLTGGAVPYLSIKGSRFNLVDATGNVRAVGQMDPQTGVIFLDCVVVDGNSVISKIYYEGAYDPNAEGLPPTCFSDNGTAPSSQATKPQSKTCASCPNNAWGSDTSRISGKATKACNDVQKLAVTIPGMEMVFQLRVPPASLKHLGKYLREIGSFSSGARKVDVTDLVTRISFQKDAIGVLDFAPVSWVDEPTLEFCEKVRNAKGTDLLVGRLDKPYTGEVVALAPARETVEPARSLPPPPPAQQAPPPAVRPLEHFGQDAPAEAAPKKGRGRPRKEEAPTAPATRAPFMGPEPVRTQPAAVNEADIEDIPDFLRRPQAGSSPAPAPPAEQRFGMVASAPAPDAEMQRKIAEAMRLPT